MITFRSSLHAFAAFAATVATTTAQDWYLEQPNQSPPARRFHGLANLGAETILFGGIDERTNTVFGDTWRYDGGQWTAAPVAGPAARSRFALCVDSTRGRVLVFGGVDANAHALDDTWAFDGTAWQLLTSGTPPLPRFGAAMSYDGARDHAVLFGGVAGSGLPALDDTWEFDGQQWHARSAAITPPARHGHTMTFDAAHNETLLFGGFTGAQSTSADTWRWNGTTWQQVVTAATPPAFVFPSMTYFQAHGLAVLVGGGGAASQPLATWIFDGTEWQPGPAAPAAQVGRQGHAVSYDPIREAVVLFGGASIGFGGAVPRADTWELAVQATFESFGSGCDGGHGVPALTARDAGKPSLGSAFVLDVTSALPFAAIAVGLSDTHFGAQTLPLDMTPFGLTGCSLLVSVDAVLPAVVTAGTATASLHVPLERGLIGLPLFAQALLLDGGPHGFGAMSNAGRAAIGN